MAEAKRPILIGKMSSPEPFQSRKLKMDKPFLPPRRRAQYKRKLLSQLQTTERKAAENLLEKVEGATHSLFTIQIHPQSEITSSAFSQKNKVEVVWENPNTHTVLVRAETAKLPSLEKKITQYGDATVEKGKAPPNQAAIAPVNSIRLATLRAISGEMLRKVGSSLDKDTLDWFEVSCIGGKYVDKAEAAQSLAQITKGLEKLELENSTLVTYEAAEKLIVFLNLSPNQLGNLFEITDCITEVEYLPPQTFTWLLLEKIGDEGTTSFKVEKPDEGAPIITLLDSGINSSHPSIQACVLLEDSVHPEDTSPVDIEGHGSLMAGTALHGPGLVGHIRKGVDQSGRHWLESIRIHKKGSKTNSDPKNRSKWAALTKQAVDAAESKSKKANNRIFTLAITSELPVPGATTSWSTAIDDLTYNEGKGRLFFVSQGNFDPINISITNNFPQENLLKKIQDPAQAVNAITVSGFTELDTLPPDDTYRDYRVVSSRGGASVHCLSGRTTELNSIKPDCVFEAGNGATDGTMVATDVSSITLPSTSHDLRRRYAPFYGTSLSTALASHFAAELWSTHPNFRPETIRALIIHSSSWNEQMLSYGLGKDDLISLFGYGTPDFRFASECLKSRATVVIEDSMSNGKIVEKVRQDKDGKDIKRKAVERDMKCFVLPIPQEELLQMGNKQVELRITLSYFAEPNYFGGQKSRGMDLIWDIQGPSEEKDEFLIRINQAKRTGKHETTKSFAKWDIGINRRKRGTVQSDRWKGPASQLAGEKMIAVYPKYGWWNERKGFEEHQTRFALVVSIVVPDLDIYTFVQQKITTPISIEIETVG